MYTKSKKTMDTVSRNSGRDGRTLVNRQKYGSGEIKILREAQESRWIGQHTVYRGPTGK